MNASMFQEDETHELSPHDSIYVQRNPKMSVQLKECLSFYETKCFLQIINDCTLKSLCCET